MRPGLPRCGMLALATIVILAPPALAGFIVPSPSNSTVPPCVPACPGGDRPGITVTVRDFSGGLIGNARVVLDACTCPNTAYCPAMPIDGYFFETPCQAANFTNFSTGQARFVPRLGGACSGPFAVVADGVLLRNPRLCSTDQNGDGEVTGADVSIHAAKIGTSDLTGDLDCNGVVNQFDANLLLEHLGHTCDQPTDVRRARWGTLKLRYR